jgi:hypothetical protein
MMGRDKPPQCSLFYSGINLDKRGRHEHVLRNVARLVDFEFVYEKSKSDIENSSRQGAKAPSDG